MGQYKELLLEREKTLEKGLYPSLTIKEQDLIKWEIMYTRLAGVVQSSRETARMISASPVVREIGECIFALYTPEGDSVCFSTGLLIHVASIGNSIKWMFKNDYEERVGIREGDYFFNNDPYIGGAHSPDQLITTPIFYDGQLVGWSGGLTHVPETGASEPGGMPPSAMTRFDEGLFLPCVRIAEEDKIKADLEIMVDRSVRTSTWWLLDNRAKIAGCRLIRDGAKAIIEEYGLSYYLKAIYEYIEDTRQACLQKMQKILFPGRYRTALFYDIPYGDKPVRFPRDYEIRIPLEMNLSAKGGMSISLEGASPPGYHPNNSSPNAVVGCLVNGLIQHLFYDIKYNQGINQGLLQAYHIELPPSCINPPDKFTACSAFATAFIAQSCLNELLSRSLYIMGFREEVIACHAMTSAMFTGGVDQYGRPFGAFIMELSCAGLGASAVEDGPDTCYAAWNPEGDMGDAEIWEQIVPQMWLGRRVHPDGGGFGKYRGGNGIESLYFVQHSDILEMGSFPSADKVFTSIGIMGAYPASSNYRHFMTSTNLAEAIEQRKPLPHSEGDDSRKPLWSQMLSGKAVLTNAQMLSRPFAPFDLFQQLTNSAGGFGDPLERDPLLVKKDLTLGFTTHRSAEKVFGVIIDPKTLEIDHSATKELREKNRQERKERGIPTREYLKRQRKLILLGFLPRVPKVCLNLCMKNSRKFFEEFIEFWQLPEDFTQIP